MGLSQEQKEENWRSTLRGMHEQFKNQLNENVFENVRDERIHHGLKITTSIIIHRLGISELCFCPDTKEYLILRNAVEVLRYTMEGKPLEPSFPLEPSMNFTRMIWCDKAKRFACFEPEGEQLWIFTRDFVIELTGKFEFQMKNVCYDEYSNELIIIGPTQSVKFILEDDKDQSQGEFETTKPVTYADPEFGPTWQLDRSSLVPKTESSPARLVITYNSTMYTVPVDLNSDDTATDDEDGFQFLEKRSSAHKSMITAVFYHAFSRWILSGDSQGTVSAWNMKFEQMMTMAGVHEDRVIQFYPHPTICGFLSYSRGPNGGHHLQVWSCNFRSKIEDFKNLGEITGIVVNGNAAAVVVLSEKLHYLTMHQTYVFFAALSSKAKRMSVSTNPMYPTKLVVASEDNSVRLFTPDAQRLNVQILPPDDLEIRCAEFSGLKNQLFTIINRNGEILVSDNTICPMKFNKVLLNDGPRITCLTIYEYFDEIRDERGRSRKPRVFIPISVRLMAGTAEGSIVILNSQTGKPEATYTDVHEGPVKNLRANIMSKHLISVGCDRCVKMWRVFADLTKPLVLYYTLNFVWPVTHIASTGTILCMVVAKSDQEYNLLMENMETRERILHHPLKDHKKKVVCMIVSERLELCATSSLDGTIRIWDIENRLRTIIDVNTCANPIQFSSVYGDIVFSAGVHLYKVPFENYLPPRYRARIAYHNIFETEEQELPTVDDDYKPYDGIVDRQAMLYAHSSLPLGSIDINSDNPRVDVLIMQQICALYNARDDEIERMKENSLEPKKLPGDRALMVTEDWEKYVTDLLQRMERVPPEVPEYDFKGNYDANREIQKTYNERAIFHMRFGYSMDELESDEKVEELSSNVRLHGFLPNSVLYKEKEPEEPKEPSVKSIRRINTRYKYPPEFYPEEKQEIKRQSLRLSQLDMGINVDE